MTKTFEDITTSKNLREHLARRFPKRGRFKELEKLSGVPEWKWKNFFYDRQAAGEDQLMFWKSTFPDDELLGRTGAELSVLRMQEDLKQAFAEFNEAAAAMKDCQLPQLTVAAQRLEMARSVFHDLFKRAMELDK